jgi:metallophosphoesterase (TIGR03767 family)
MNNLNKLFKQIILSLNKIIFYLSIKYLLMSFSIDSSATMQCNKHFKKGGTTLDYSIIPDLEPANMGITGSYYKLQYGPGEKVIVRPDLLFHKKIHYENPCKDNVCKDSFYNNTSSNGSADVSSNVSADVSSNNGSIDESYFHKRINKNRHKTRKALATFVQITDVHIIDAASPSRVAFLAQFVPLDPALADSFRPYEAFSCQVAECMLRKINAIKKGPHLKQPIQFCINCGDTSDTMEFNELQNDINLMDGGMVYSNPICHYEGVQDNFPAVNYEAYYHPDCPPAGENPDLYKVFYGYPNYPDILQSATKPFQATGIKMPWYIGNGNHDVTKLGNYSLGYYKMFTLFDQISTGNIPGLGSKLIEAMAPVQAQALSVSLATQNSDSVLKIINNSILRDVNGSQKRKQFTRADFISAFFNTNSQPPGHGFTERNIQENVAYYTFQISENITGVMLDTTNINGDNEDLSIAPNGSIGRIQLSWLEEELRRRHSMYYNNLWEPVYTDNKDHIILLFGHHTIETMNNITTNPTTFDNDPQKIDGPTFAKIMWRYPNVIAFINGHEHLNKVTPYKNLNGKTPGFWEINTASHIDYPQESRIIEISDNGDGTLSIFATIFDHLSPPDAQRGCFSTGPAKNCSCGVKNTSQAPTPFVNPVENNISGSTAGFCNSNPGVTGLYTRDIFTPNLYYLDECPEEKYSISEIASISRELSINDPFIVGGPSGFVYRFGTPCDRNVELIVPNPLTKNSKNYKSSKKSSKDSTKSSTRSSKDSNRFSNRSSSRFSNRSSTNSTKDSNRSSNKSSKSSTDSNRSNKITIKGAHIKKKH